MTEHLIELFSGRISRVDPEQQTIEIEVESNFGQPLAEDMRAVFAIYVPTDRTFQVGQKVTNYIAVEEK